MEIINLLFALMMYVPHTPEIVMINGTPTVYYELHIAGTTVPDKLEVFNRVGHITVASFEKDELKKRSKVLEDETVIFLELPVFKAVELGHRVGSEEGAFVKIGEMKPLVLGAPLKNGRWTTIYASEWPNGHRRVLFAVNGKKRIPGRFAIDFVKVDEKGLSAPAGSDSVKDWFGYGDPVLAVADAKVVATREDFKERSTVSGKTDYPAERATGNYVSLDLGNNRFAFYEHLQPGSIKVKPGQRVRKGDVIAALGFTGQSTEPHLHFHVADANSPLGAEGVPFVFESFILLPSLNKVGMERPGPNAVISF